MRAKPWEVPDPLWERIEPLLPRKQRRFRYPGRKPVGNREALTGILMCGWSTGFFFAVIHRIYENDQRAA